MKKKGDMKHAPVANVGQVIDDMIERLEKQPPRLKAFWDYKPIPLYLGEKSHTTVSEDGFFRTKKKIRAIVGGNRSVKTYNSIYELIAIFTGIVPPCMQGVWPWEQALKDCLPGGRHPRARRTRIIVQNYTTHWATAIRPILLQQEQDNDTGLLPEGYDDWNPEEHLFTGPDGSMLHIYSADPREQTDPIFLRGGAFDATVIDEPNSQTVFEESVARTIAVPHGLGFVTLCYCPEDGFEAWHYKRIYQAGYDFQTYEPLPPEKVNPDIFVQVATPMDNPSVTEAGLAALRAACRPWQIEAKVNGRYSAQGDNSFFSIEILSNWQIKPDLKAFYEYADLDMSDVNTYEGEFEAEVDYITAEEGDRICDKDDNERVLWKVWHRPVDKHKYILIADCAAGRAKGDYQCADILDATDYAKPFQVAQLRIRKCTILDFSAQCAAMATDYGEILVAPEANTYGEAFIDNIREYPDIYIRTNISSRIENPDEKKYGWSSNIHSKLNMLENLDEFLKKCNAQNFIPIRSQSTLNELMSYQEKIKSTVYGEVKREWGAKSGMHDDTVTTLGIGVWIIRKEYEKLSVSHLVAREAAKKHIDLHAQRMKKYPQSDRGFGKMLGHKKRSLVQLRGNRNQPRRRDNG